ncbi:4-diphosphocytidyl-2-C-methyl-D-erythritol kinase [Bacilli bacterium PM5-3]|nr:4-diphosphocytidyl-2-C-methyl-D-erythritol kinase [Bacilli bacterium PM5-3]
MIKKSYAKINFSINIVEKMPNGYHNLDMIMTKINLFDKLYFSTTKNDEIILTCTNPFIPTDERNLVYKVAKLVKEKFNIKKGIRIHIAKTIPMQAGLGGGSSNAATTLEALDEMFMLNLSIEEKIDLVKNFGADIPFFFYDCACRVQGIGDIITPIESNLSDFHLILVKPQKGVSTKLAYENIDLKTCDHPNIDKLVNALKDNDYNYVCDNIGNSLQDSAIVIRPVIKDIQDELMALGVDTTLVCGSGSTIFALTKDNNVVKNVKAAHFNKKNFVFITSVR